MNANDSMPSRLASVATQHQPASETAPLVVEPDPQTVRSDRLVNRHDGGDLLPAGPAAAFSR